MLRRQVITVPAADSQGGGMSRVRVDREHPDPAVIADAAERIHAGELVGFPTETVYGLGGHALDAAAIARIYAAKGRPAYNPLIVHCADVEAARGLVGDWTAEAEGLAQAFWPGPLTLVLPKASLVPDTVTAGLPTVALRVPDHPVATALLRAAGVPVAAPSANLFTRLSPTTAEHVERGLGNAVSLVLDAGPTSVGIESTVVDLSGPEPVLLRPGTIPADRIAAVLGRPLRAAPSRAGNAPRPAPGMTERHYAPRARLVLVPAGDAAALEEAVAGAAADTAHTAALLRTLAPPQGVAHARILPDEPLAYARSLYASLHELDDLGCFVVLVENVPGGAAWAGVRDRLARAARTS